MNKRQKLIPELRFPEFKNDGDWEETILGEVAEYTNGKAHEKEISETGKYKVVNSKFISTDGEVVKYTNSANLKANIGDILMVLSDIPNGKAIAKCFYVDKDNTYTVNQRICKITPINIDNKFLFYIQNRNKYFLAFDDGVKQTNLRKDTVLSFSFLKPKNKKEQKKIAGCLSSLDDLITVQTEKLALLKDHKKGLLQQLFPKAGETRPKLRFPEFKDDGEWEETTLGSLSKITTGKLDANAMVKNGKFRFYTCARDFYFIDNYLFDTEALLISGNGANVGYIHYYKGKFNAYQRTYVLYNFEKNIIYLKYYLEFNLNKRIATNKKDGNTPYIVKSTLSEMQVLVPTNPKEQQKIAGCLSSLDDLITVQTEKLALLKEHKKGLLQKLFP